MSRPPVGSAVACTVPLWTVAMDDTKARPRSNPSWRVRSSSKARERSQGHRSACGHAHQRAVERPQNVKRSVLGVEKLQPAALRTDGSRPTIDSYPLAE